MTTPVDPDDAAQHDPSTEAPEPVTDLVLLDLLHRAAQSPTVHRNRPRRAS